jgi:hypothetical protein
VVIPTGQYYRIVNIDKKEFISPRAFKDGAKLLEFAGGDCGVISGLAILMASGNGRGGGDFYTNTCYGKDIDISLPKNKHLRIDSSFTTGVNDEKVCNLIVPKVVGKWAGDRVVIAGDYADEGAFIDADRPLNAKEKKYVEGKYTEPFKSQMTSTKSFNLDSWADLHFKDISKQVIKGLKFDPNFNECMQKREK